MPTATTRTSKRKATRATAAAFIPPLPSAADRACENKDLLLEILGFCEVRDVGVASGINSAFREAAGSDVVWGELLLQRYRSSGPLLRSLPEGTARAFYRARLREEKPKKKKERKPEAEEKRLKRALANTFIELRITDMSDDGSEIASRLIAVTEEEETIVSLFKGERIRLSLETAYVSDIGYEDYRVEMSLMQVAPTPKILRLGLREGFYVDHEEKEREGKKAAIAISDDGCHGLTFPPATKVEVHYHVELAVIETYDVHDRDDATIDLYAQPEIVTDGDIEPAADSYVGALSFLEAMLKGKTLWIT